MRDTLGFGAAPVEGSRRKGQYTCFLDEFVDGVGLRTKLGEEACCYDVSFSCVREAWVRPMRCNECRLMGMRGIMFVGVLFTKVISDGNSWRKGVFRHRHQTANTNWHKVA